MYFEPSWVEAWCGEAGRVWRKEWLRRLRCQRSGFGTS